MISETNRTHNTLKTPNYRRRRRVLGGMATGAAVVSSYIGLHAIDKPQHGAATMKEIAANVGHIPAGIESIKKTATPGVEEVHYVVQPEPDKMFVSSIAADLHPMAPNQDATTESGVINTYLPKPYSLYGGEELNLMVNTDKGEILPNPQSSVENHS